MPWISLCELGELSESAGKHVDIDGYSLAVYLHAGKVFVLDAVCPHAGRDISGGTVTDGCAVCPWHGWMFQLTDGEVPGMPGMGTRTYPARLFSRTGLATLVQADLPMP